MARSLISRLDRLLPPHLRFVLLACLIAAFVFSVTMLILDYTQGVEEESELKELAVVVSVGLEIPNSVPSNIPELSQTPKQPVILEQYRDVYEQNTDMAGWIKIDGTVINYPAMYTANDFYLSHGFDKEESKSGTPFIDKRCPLEPFGTNTIIYGHHMKNGTMFADLLEYMDEEYYRNTRSSVLTHYTHSRSIRSSRCLKAKFTEKAIRLLSTTTS